MNRQVAEFHRVFGLAAPSHPPLRPDPATVRLRMRLIDEEFKEVMEELSTLARLKDPIEITANYQRLLKELVDLCYVAVGAAVSFGLPFDAAVAEVHRSNMSKLDADGKPLYLPGGKVGKSPLYSPADMVRLVPNIIEAP